MARKVRTTFIYVVAFLVFCATLYHHYLRAATDPLRPSATVPLTTVTAISALHHDDTTTNFSTPPKNVSPPPISATSVLLPDWEVLVVVSPEETPHLSPKAGDYVCVYDTGETSPAKPAGILPYPDRLIFRCRLTRRARRRLPFKQPALVKAPENHTTPPVLAAAPILLRWNFVVYDSLTSDEDVILFVKGVNHRQGMNRDPSECRCVFGDDSTSGVRTAVTTSMQEVFRCRRPELTAVNSSTIRADSRKPVKVSLEIVAENLVVPTLAYYTPPRKLDKGDEKSLLCTATMVYNVAKFLKEWVSYHSKIGVEKFLLYDNGSDDEFGKIVRQLVQQGYNIHTYFWFWPKTQEAGFSHSVIYAKDSCTWMVYLDVDEFVYSPSWHEYPTPSSSMLQSLISPRLEKFPNEAIGQLSIECREFGPSDQVEHPPMGVVQGYNCRRKLENRHKSIVLLDAVDDALLNSIHHFYLKVGYRASKLSTKDMVINHYKYQAWPEFKAKFRRRVSAYVLDWTQKHNPKSNDRAPGLGFTPVEPEGWPQKFCEVKDYELKDLTWKWFGVESPTGSHMAWLR